MASSHYKCDILANGDYSIAGFSEVSATALVGALTGNVAGNVTGNVTGNLTLSTADGGSYVKMGTTQYFMFGDLQSEASIVAVATALTATPTGSLYCSSAGSLWLFGSSSTASPVSIP